MFLFEPCVCVQPRVHDDTMALMTGVVLTMFPSWFGEDSPAQRDVWATQLLWCYTTLDTRNDLPQSDGRWDLVWVSGGGGG